MNCAKMNCIYAEGMLFEEPDASPTYVCTCAPFGSSGNVVKDGLEVDVESSDRLDVSHLTQDTAILNSYVYSNDNACAGGDRGDGPRNGDVMNTSQSTELTMKSSWLVSTLKRRNSKQDLYRMSKSQSTSCLKDLDIDTSTSTPSPNSPTTGTVMNEEVGLALTASCDLSVANDGILEDVVVSRPTSPNRATKSLTLNLDEYDDMQFELVVQHIRGRSDLARLEVYRNDPDRKQKNRRGGRRDMNDMGRFFAEVGGLSTLKEVVLWNFTPDCSWLLTCFLKERPILTSFRLHQCRGTASKDLLKALAQLPTLTKLVLEMQHEFPVDILLTSTSLESLKIEGSFTLSQKNMNRSSRILGVNNRALQSLDLKCFITELGLHELSSAMQHNPTLEKLTFSYRSQSVKASGEVLLDMAKTISHNRSLKEVVNRRYRSVTVTNDVRALADEFLQPNTTLECFQFYNKAACVEDPIVAEDSFDFLLEETTERMKCTNTCSTSNTDSQAMFSCLNSCGIMEALYTQ